MCEALFNRITEAILDGIKIRLKLKLQKPCPFGSGLRKFALDFVVVVFFFKYAEKNTCTPLIPSEISRENARAWVSMDFK